MVEKAKNEFEEPSILEICQMTKSMVAEVTHVHLQAFNGAMNTRLGKTYVRKFLDWFVQIEGGIALVAILKTRGSEQIVGYVVGAPLGYGKAMNRDLFWTACWNAIIRPWLFLSEQFRAIIKARVRSFMQSSYEQTSKVALPMPVMSLVGLGVMPNHQGKNIGKELLFAFEKRAHDLHVRSIRLSVYPENVSARRVYEKCGWLACEHSLSSGKAMSYSRIL